MAKTRIANQPVPESGNNSLIAKDVHSTLYNCSCVVELLIDYHSRASVCEESGDAKSGLLLVHEVLNEAICYAAVQAGVPNG